MIVVVGRARAVPGGRGALVRAASEMAARTRDDDGCESYGFYSDLADEDVVVSLEIWRDRESLDAHLHHPHTETFLAAVSDLLAGTPEMRLLEATAAD